MVRWSACKQLTIVFLGAPKYIKDIIRKYNLGKPIIFREDKESFLKILEHLKNMGETKI